MQRRLVLAVFASAALFACGFCLAAAMGVSFHASHVAVAVKRPALHVQQKNHPAVYVPQKMSPAQAAAADKQARDVLARAARAAFAVAKDTKRPTGTPLWTDQVIKGIQFEAPELHVVYGPRSKALRLRPLTVVVNERTNGWTDDMFTMSRTGTVWELYSRCCLWQQGKMGPMRFSVHHPFDAFSNPSARG